jgi:hypothetical protein
MRRGNPAYPGSKASLRFEKLPCMPGELFFAHLDALPPPTGDQFSTTSPFSSSYSLKLLK